MLFCFSAMHFPTRLRQSLPIAAVHLAGSVLVAACLAALILWVWYPHPYDAFSGGRTLFFLLIGVDMVCGPLLTLLLYTKTKPPRLLFIDFGLILFLQSAALSYGIATAWHARPVYLVAEVDRFKAISRSELTSEDIAKLPNDLRTDIWKKPMIVGIRPPVSVQEKNSVLFESLQGGRDYAERPEFYTHYNAESASKALSRAKQIEYFLEKHPESRSWVENYSSKSKIPIKDMKYLPIVAREDWIAILDSDGYIAEFLKGDGF